MKARILHEPAAVIDADQMPVSSLPVGQEVEMGGIKLIAGKKYVEVKLPDGRLGFVDGGIKIYHIKLVTLMQPEATVYTDTSPQSLVRTRFRRGDKFYLTEAVKKPDQTWVRVRDEAGMEGFVEEQTKIKVVPVANKAVARQNMLRGALWCGGGAVVTFATYSSVATSGGTYFIAFGPMIYGAIQFFTGLRQYFTAAV